MKDKSLPLPPEQRIKELETQLGEANEKAALFEAMLDVIRDEYGVRLPKKSSVGSSSKKKVAGLRLARACRYIGISRQAYYKRCHAEKRRADSARTSRYNRSGKTPATAAHRYPQAPLPAQKPI